MNTETKSEATRLLACCHHANQIAEQIICAHYIQSYANPDYHIDHAHKSFERMAEILGYKIEREDIKPPLDEAAIRADERAKVVASFQGILANLSPQKAKS